MQINVTVQDANNILCEVTPPQPQIIVIDRGVAGNGIVSIVPVTISTFQYLRITYTNGTVQDVGPLTSTAYTATSPITIVGNTISLATVPIASGGTDATTAAGAIQNLLPSYTGNANKRLGLNSGATALEWVTDGGGTVTSVNASGGTTGLTFSGGPITSSGTLTLSGTLAIANGGTGQITANAAFNALVPSQTGNAGKYLTTDGTDTSWATNPLGTVTSVAATVPSFLSVTGSPITTSGTLAITYSGTALPIANGGTGQTTANAALNALLPTQTGNASKYLQTDGTNSSWDAISLSTSDITGILGTANGGTGLGGSTPFTANGVVYASSTSALTTGSSFTFDGTNLSVPRILQSGSGTYGVFNSSGAGNAWASYQYASSEIGEIGQGSGIISGGSNTDFGIRATNNLVFGISYNEKMRLNSSGQLLIGTTSAYNNERLVVDSINGSTAYNSVFVNSSTSTTVYSSSTWRVGESTTAVGYVGTGGSAVGNTAFRNNFVVGTQTASPLVFNTSDSEKARITATGNFGLGTTSPTKRLQFGTTTSGSVASPIAFQFADDYSSGYTADACKLFLYNLGGSEIYGIGTGPASDIQYHAGGVGNALGRHAWYSGNSEKMRLEASGNLGIGTSSPSNKLHVVSTTSDTPFRSDTSVAYNFISLVNSTGNAFIGSNGNNLIFQPAGTTQLTLNNSGNLGLGVTPTSNARTPTLQVGGGGVFRSENYNGSTNHQIKLIGNGYEASDTSYKYLASANASMYNQISGVHAWYNAPSGTAGNAITFTQAMTLNANGNFSLGTTSPSEFSGYITQSINGTNGSFTEYRQNNTNTFRIGADNSAGGFLFTQAANPIRFGINGSESARIDGSGNFLIGTTTSAGAGKLTVAGGINSVNGALNVAGNGGFYNSSNKFGVDNNAGASRLYSSGANSSTRGSFEFHVTDSVGTLDTVAMNLSSNGNLTVTAVGVDNTLTLNSTAGAYTSVLKLQAAGGGGSVINATGASSDALIFQTTGTERARINSSGVFDLASGAGAVGQIQFPATQVASSNANTLDDYEEGNWTPTLSGTSGGSYTMGGVNSGRYIKIGKMVYATATLQWTGQTTAYSGNVCVQGLPFTAAGTRSIGSLGAVSGGISFTSGYGEWNYLVDPGYTFVYIIQNSTTGSGYSHTPTVATTGLIYALTIVYEANS